MLGCMHQINSSLPVLLQMMQQQNSLRPPVNDTASQSNPPNTILSDKSTAPMPNITDSAALVPVSNRRLQTVGDNRRRPLDSSMCEEEETSISQTNLATGDRDGITYFVDNRASATPSTPSPAPRHSTPLQQLVDSNMEIEAGNTSVGSSAITIYYPLKTDEVQKEVVASHRRIRTTTIAGNLHTEYPNQTFV